MNSDMKEIKYFEKDWIYLIILNILIIFCFPFCSWVLFFFDDIMGHHDPISSYLGFFIIIVGMFMVVLMIILLLNIPIFFRFDSESFQVEYFYSLIKKRYFIKDINAFYFYPREPKSGWTLQFEYDWRNRRRPNIILLNVENSMIIIEYVPNQVIRYFYANIKREKIHVIDKLKFNELMKTKKLADVFFMQSKLLLFKSRG